MSNLAYHAQHFKSGSVGAVGKHNWEKRSKEDAHSNQDIDTTRSHLNFQPQPLDGSLYMAAKRRIQEACTGRVTANSNWITETIVYPPEDVIERYKETQDDTELRRYGADVLEWHQRTFGAANVLASTVHLDETTPHQHTDLVPLTEEGKLSSKEVFARKNLRSHHTELAKFLSERGWDITRGESTLGKQVVSKTVSEYKKDAEAAKMEIKKEITGLQKEVDTLTVQAKEGRQTVNSLIDRTRSVRQENLAAYNALQKTTAKLDERRETIKELDAFIEGSRDEIASYEEQIDELRDTHHNLSEEVKTKRQELQEACSGVERAEAKAEAIRDEEAALTASVGALEAKEAALRGQIADAADELDILNEAIKEKNAEGARRMGTTEWRERVRQRRTEAKIERKENLLAKFAQFLIDKFPEIRKLWERFQAENTREKEQKKRSGREHDE